MRPGESGQRGTPLSLLRSLSFPLATHGLRRGLHSFAAPRLGVFLRGFSVLQLLVRIRARAVRSSRRLDSGASWAAAFRIAVHNDCGALEEFELMSSFTRSSPNSSPLWFEPHSITTRETSTKAAPWAMPTVGASQVA